jgi:hypothetical protein
MDRDLVWLENQSFAAWGCSTCGWITPRRPVAATKASAPVCAAFAKHNCAEFPRYISPRERRPPRPELGH